VSCKQILNTAHRKATGEVQGLLVALLAKAMLSYISFFFKEDTRPIYLPTGLNNPA
jgi:hypothetical protein